MYHYSDPTASLALRDINREFTRLEKKARRLRQLYEDGKISSDDLARAQRHFTGIYRHVLRHVMEEGQK